MRIHALAILATLAPAALAQHDWRANNIVVPQRSAWALDATRGSVAITHVRARVEILDLVATTTLEVDLHNPTRVQAEAEVLLPVPAGATVRGFAFDGPAEGATAELLPLDQATRTYESIVAELRDPALLEFAGHALVRSSVFPVPAQGEQRVRVVYEQLLDANDGRLDYVLPRSESLAALVPWALSVDVRSSAPIAALYSPSHPLETTTRTSSRVAAHLPACSTLEPGSFRLSVLAKRDDLTATLFAYPDASVGGGYFLLVAGLPDDDDGAREAVKREVTIVLDRSGSMGGGKLEQAKAAALQIVEGLAPGESFQILDYANEVERLSTSAVVKSPETIAAARSYLADMGSGGGTNIHDALVTALSAEPSAGVLPMVLFLTDGLPTVGETAEATIREAAVAANTAERRVYCFGIGHDVNAPLLDAVSRATRGSTTYVQPDEDVEVAVADVAKRLYGPLFTDPTIATLGADGAEDPTRLRAVLPAPLPDLFAGEPLVVLGTYRGDEPLRVELGGELLGDARAFTYRFDLDRASPKNAFVARLWASRRIAGLADEIRQAGADPAQAAQLAGDPRFEELASEILELSTRFGVLTEYTAFLATEGTDLGDTGQLLASVHDNLQTQAVATRWGPEAVNWARNNDHQVQQRHLNVRNAYWNEAGVRVEIANVQQVGSNAYFRRGERWVSSTLVGTDDLERADRVVELGTDAHAALLEALVEHDRQGELALDGEILLEVAGERVLVVGPERTEP